MSDHCPLAADIGGLRIGGLEVGGFGYKVDPKSVVSKQKCINYIEK